MACSCPQGAFGSSTETWNQKSAQLKISPEGRRDVVYCQDVHTLNTIFNVLDGLFVGAVGATEDFAPGFNLNAVPDDLATTVSALGRQGVDGALEAVENMRLTGGEAYFKSLVGVVPADVTRGHFGLLLGPSGQKPPSTPGQ